jgi:hypothetical protein
VFRRGTPWDKLGDLAFSMDVIPWRAGDFDARGAHVVASLPATILREGRLLYDARRVTA